MTTRLLWAMAVRAFSGCAQQALRGIAVVLRRAGDAEGASVGSLLRAVGTAPVAGRVPHRPSRRLDQTQNLLDLLAGVLGPPTHDGVRGDGCHSTFGA